MESEAVVTIPLGLIVGTIFTIVIGLGIIIGIRKAFFNGPSEYEIWLEEDKAKYPELYKDEE